MPAEWQYKRGLAWHVFDQAAIATLEFTYKAWLLDSAGIFTAQGRPTVNSGTFVYQVDFERMVQRNQSTNRERRIRRLPLSVALQELRQHMMDLEAKMAAAERRAEDLEKRLHDESQLKAKFADAAKHLEKCLDDEVQLKAKFADAAKDLEKRFDDEVHARLSLLPVEPSEAGGSSLDQSSGTFRFLESLVVRSVTQHRAAPGSDDWREPPRLEVVSIRDICASDPLEAYATSRKTLSRQHPEGCRPLPTMSAPKILGSRLNEYLLFHGAPANSISQIIRSGFDAQRGGERGVGQTYQPMFGVGTYFADLSSKSDAYATPAADGSRTLIVARVLLGNAHIARESMRNQERAPDGYHSICGVKRVDEGGALDHREYVIFKDPQALPLFAVHYRHHSECKCATCTR